MYIKVKKIVSLVLICVFSFLLVNQNTFAKTNNLKSILDNSIKNSKYNLETKELSKNEMFDIDINLNKNIEIQKFNKKIEKENFYEIKKDGISSLSVYDKYTKDEILLIHKVYKNDNNSYIFLQIMYSKNINKPLYILSNLISEKGEVKNFETKEIFNLKSDFQNKGWPTFPSWLCFMSSTAACGVYCTALGLIHIAVGVGCSFVCGGLFHAACDGIK